MKCDLKLSSLIQSDIIGQYAKYFRGSSCMMMRIVRLLLSHCQLSISSKPHFLFYAVLKLAEEFIIVNSRCVCALAVANIHSTLYTFIYGFARIGQKTQFIFIIFNFQLNADNAAVYDTVIFAGLQPAGPMKQVKRVNHIISRTNFCYRLTF